MHRLSNLIDGGARLCRAATLLTILTTLVLLTACSTTQRATLDLDLPHVEYAQ